MEARCEIGLAGVSVFWRLLLMSFRDAGEAAFREPEDVFEACGEEVEAALRFLDVR